jgi:hypothetical protein
MTGAGRSGPVARLPSQLASLQAGYSGLLCLGWNCLGGTELGGAEFETGLLNLALSIGTFCCTFSIWKIVMLAG